MTAIDETLHYFNRLGTEVEQEWAAAGRKCERLAAIASAALTDLPIPEGLTPEIILSLLAAGTDLPKQRPSSDGFGQPPAVMYRNTNFQIQALTWMEGTTSIHQHGFDGAFRVTSGSSLHVRYSFEQSETMADGHLVAGRLAMVEQEILRVDDVRPIVSGPDFIHALFHLERPSMTIVVRNGSSELPFPQYSYRLPGLGFDVLEEDDRLRARLRGLHSLYRLDRDRAAAVALDVVNSQDLWTSFRVCNDWALTYGQSSELSALIGCLSARANALGEILPPLFAEDVRRGRLLARRGLLRESRHRLFLALIINLPDRASIHAAMAQFFPDRDPAVVIADLVEELASPQYRGISGISLEGDELAALRNRLLSDADDALAAIADHWKPPSLVESLFS